MKFFYDLKLPVIEGGGGIGSGKAKRQREGLRVNYM